MVRIATSSRPLVVSTTVVQPREQQTTAAATTTAQPPTTAAPPAPCPPTLAQATAATVAASLAALAATDPAAASTKQQKLALSPFAFFRGTVEIFANQHARTSTGATVLLNGDVHPMNFGCVKGKDGDAVFALNDFDEAARGAFSYDVKRGAAGFALLCDEQKLSPADRNDVVDAFVSAYVAALSGDKFKAVVDEDDAHGAVKAGLAAADHRTQRELLDEVVAHGHLRPAKDLTPAPQLKDDVERALRATFGDGVGVKDVAEKTGAGIGSLGARRLLVLLDNDVLLELKTAAPPALTSRSPSSSRLPSSSAQEAARVVKAAAAQTRGADRWSATTTLGTTTFVVREKSPQRRPLELFTMGKRDLADVAAAAGAVLAGAHVWGGGGDRDKRAATAERILASMGKKKDFKQAMLAFAEAEAAATRAAHAAFVATLPPTTR